MTPVTINKVHLSAEQRQLCIDFRDGFSERPTPGQYEAFRVHMQAVNPLYRPKAKEIPHTVRGFGRGDVKLLDSFNALIDLPEGWAVTSCHDSGGNHTLESAGDAVLRLLWNCWTPGGSPKQNALLENNSKNPTDTD